MKVAYISDIHIEFMLNTMAEKLGKTVSVAALAALFCKRLSEQECDFAVLAGDIGHCTERNIEFLNEADKLTDKKIFVCLGNHDYWDWGRESRRGRGRSIEDLEKIYEEQIARTKNIELLVAGKTVSMGNLIIIGDCAFAGYNKDFNAANGIYRDTLISPIAERALSNRWREFYNATLKEAAAEGKKVLAVTHMSVEEWGGSINPDILYISGHIHDCKHDEAHVTVTDNYKGDAANGYYAWDFNFKTLTIQPEKQELKE